MPDHEKLLESVEAVQDLRRAYQQKLDDHKLQQARSANPAGLESLTQTLAAMVRLLDTAAKNLHDAVTTLEQEKRVRASLAG